MYAHPSDRPLFTRLAPVLNVSDLAAERAFYEKLGLPVIAERCRSAGLDYELEHHQPAPDWKYRRLLLRTPSGYRLALEGESE